MKKIAFISLVIVIFCVAALIQHNSNPRIVISKIKGIEDKGPGEYVYSLNMFGFLPVGEAVVGVEKEELYQGKSVYYMSARATSLKVIAKFFQATALIEAYIEKKHLLPILFRQVISQRDKPDMAKEAVYNQMALTMTTAKGTRDILPETVEPLSLLLRLKRMNLSTLKNFDFNLNNNQRNYSVKGIVESRDVFVNKKRYPLFFLKSSISRRDKNPYHKSGLEIVFLPSRENIPLIIKVFASGIFINARLVEIRR